VKNRSRTFKLLLGFILLIGAWVLLAPFFAERLIVEKKLEQTDAILILAGSSVYIERTDRAAEIFKQGVAPKIVLTDDGEKTGWSRAEKRNIPYVEMARRNLVAQGVPAADIEIFKPDGSGTIYEAQIIKEKAREKGWQSILIVTSAYHTRRALQTFENVLADENVQIGIVSAPTGQGTPPPFYWWLTAQGWNWVASEYVKILYYWVYY